MNFLIMMEILYVFQYILKIAYVNADKFSSDLVPSKVLLQFNKSLVISPLALRLSCYKLVSFARGDVKEELLKVLGYQSDHMINSIYGEYNKILSQLKRIDFVMLNHIYLNYTNEYKEAQLSAAYGVDVHKVSFNYPETSVAYINQMVDRLMYKRISDVILKNDLSKETTMLIINAAYLTATWEVPFNIEKTKYRTHFHRYNQSSVTVPMMYKSEEVFYINDDFNKIKVINMKLASPRVSMTVVIPEDLQSFKDFLSNLMRPNFFRTIKKRMRMDLLSIGMPRFKLKTLVDLTTPLQMIGLLMIFNQNNTGLNNIYKNYTTAKHLFVNKIKQKNSIEVNEMGAFRVVHKSKSYNPLLPPNRKPPMEAVADRPFYFTFSLHHDRSDYWSTEELFTGVYYGPDT